MSTKTVKLNSLLHEELKKIAEKEGFVLQDLIEEKLNEVLEEKGIYNFQPTDIKCENSNFILTLSPEQYYSLIILLKRLCLNEKIQNITQMGMLVNSISILEEKYNDFTSDPLQLDKSYTNLMESLSGQINKLRTENNESVQVSIEEPVLKAEKSKNTKIEMPKFEISLEESLNKYFNYINHLLKQDNLTLDVIIECLENLEAVNEKHSMLDFNSTNLNFSVDVHIFFTIVYNKALNELTQYKLNFMNDNLKRNIIDMKKYNKITDGLYFIGIENEAVILAGDINKVVELYGPIVENQNS